MSLDMLIIPLNRDKTSCTLILQDASCVDLLTKSWHVFFRVSSILDDLRGDLTEQVSFRTECCEPDPPAPPKFSTRTKTSLLLKWNVSNIKLCCNNNKVHLQYFQ